jgi:hypothetical protein
LSKLRAPLAQSLSSHHWLRQELFRDGQDPGNAVYPQAAALQHILESPEVVGACTSLLGPDYLLHAHRRCHESRPGRCDQYHHQDSYKGRAIFRHHRPFWLMGMYYPQVTATPRLQAPAAHCDRPFAAASPPIRFAAPSPPRRRRVTAPPPPS